MKELFLAICIVESGCDPTALGDAGEVGVAQIRRICVDDVNRILALRGSPIRYRYEDRLDIRKSFQMFRTYTDHYVREHNDEKKSRVWNGGPRGPSKPATAIYWKKVKKELHRLRAKKALARPTSAGGAGGYTHGAVRA